MQPGVYFINLKSGFRCVRKLIGGRLGRQELAVYERLQEYCKYTHDPQHPGVEHFIPEWSTGQWSEGQYLELPYHIPLSEEMRKGGSYLESHALLLCAQLSEGIDFLHSQLKVAHMDIKPDNLVLARPQYTLKIIDFNLSVVDVNRMITGVRGTKGYMAPEVQEGDQYWPFLADRYSCGICMKQFLEQGQYQENYRPSYLAFEIFAAKLRSWTPSKRPSLMDRPDAIGPSGSTGPNGGRPSLTKRSRDRYLQLSKRRAHGWPPTRLVSAVPVEKAGVLHSRKARNAIGLGSTDSKGGRRDWSQQHRFKKWTSFTHGTPATRLASATPVQTAPEMLN